MSILNQADCSGTVTAFLDSAATVGQVTAQRQTGDFCNVSLTVSAGPSTSAAGCSTLVITAGQVGAGLGHVGFALTFRNNGRVSCTLNGYPTVTATESGSRRIVTGHDSPSGYLGGTDVPVPTLYLHPGDAVSSFVEGTDMPVGNATSCPRLTGMRVTVNGHTTAVPPTLTYCGGLGVHPYVPGITGTAR